MPELISTKTIFKARKQHVCSYCGGLIDVGERYTLSFIKNDGVYEWKEHEYCNSVAEEFFQSGYFVDDGDGMFAEDFENLVSELHAEHIDSGLRYSVKAMSKALAGVFKTHQLKPHRPHGYTEKWMLVEREK